MSVGEVLAVAFWIPGWFDPKVKRFRMAKLTQSFKYWYFPLLFLWMIVGLIWTSDLKEGFQELNIKHAFVLFPLLLGSIQLQTKDTLYLFGAFIVANVCVATLITMGHYFKLYVGHMDAHNLSPFVQRPRASLFLAFALILSLYFILNRKTYKSFKLYFILIILFSLLIFTGLFNLDGRIGQIGFFIGLIPLVIYSIKWQASRWLKFIVLSLGCSILFCFLIFKAPKVNFIFKEAFAEIEQYRNGFKGVDAMYSSVGQRLVYYDRYLKICNSVWPLGVGTGDIIVTQNQLFADRPYGLKGDKPHNEFLEMLVKLGIVGIGLLILALYKTFVNINPNWLGPGYAFMALLILSMLTDATFGTQAGITFSLCFLVLFVQR